MSEYRNWAKRASERQAVAELVREAERAPLLAATIEAFFQDAKVTLEEAHAILNHKGGCACMGGPPEWHHYVRGIPCYCHLRHEAAYRALEAAGEPLPPERWSRLPGDRP